MDKDMKKVSGRDLKAEAAELLRKYPRLKGQQLGEEVIRAALMGEALVDAYERYHGGELMKENQRLREELEEERRHKAVSRRAPVRGVSGGEPTGIKGEDDFLRGFNAQ